MESWLELAVTVAFGIPKGSRETSSPFLSVFIGTPFLLQPPPRSSSDLDSTTLRAFIACCSLSSLVIGLSSTPSLADPEFNDCVDTWPDSCLDEADGGRGGLVVAPGESQLSLTCCRLS